MVDSSITSPMKASRSAGLKPSIPRRGSAGWRRCNPLSQFIISVMPRLPRSSSKMHDMSVSEEDALAYQTAGSEPKKVEWYDSGHGLPAQAYTDMVAWLAEQIGIS